MNQAVSDKLKETFGLDQRSLALFRICLGTILMTDLARRSLDLTAHYTDLGVLPRQILIGKFSGIWQWSLHNSTGSFAGQAFIFAIHFIFALMFTLGYQTKLANFFCWLLITSLQTRNQLVLQGGDVLFRMLFFWSMFLPTAARYSLDALWDPRAVPVQSKNVLSIGTIAIHLQIVFVYLFAVILKDSVDWRVDNSAVYYALMIDQFIRPAGKWILAHPGLLSWLTFTVFWWEALGWLLLFCPFFTGLTRCLAVFGFIGMHIGFFSCMQLGFFPFVSSCAMLPFLPAIFWEKLFAIGQRFFSYSLTKLNLIFCKIHNFLLSLKPHFAASYSHGPISRFIIYPLAKLFCLIALITATYWNYLVLNPKAHIPPSVDIFAWQLRLDQKWNMFAPMPLRADGWYVIPAKLKNGKEIDLFKALTDLSTQSPIDWSKPEYVADTYKRERWRKYMMNLFDASLHAYLLYFGQYLCRQWNKTHRDGELLDQFQIIYMREDTLPDFQVAPIFRQVLWQHYCFQVPQAGKK